MGIYYVTDRVCALTYEARPSDDARDNPSSDYVTFSRARVALIVNVLVLKVDRDLFPFDRTALVLIEN